MGNISTVKYDSQGRVLQQTDALGNNKRYSYDTLGNLLHVTDENGSVAQYYYDGAGNRISEADATGMHQSWQYDVLDRVIADLDGNGNRVEIAYDSLDRVVQHGSTTFYYDDTYHKTKQGDTSVDMGMGTTTSYDLDGRVIGTSALNNASNNGYSNVSSSRSYDAYGNLTSETDEEGRTKRSVNGPNSRLLST